MKLQRSGRQGGAMLLGLVIGLLVGLVVALGVALYVTKVPVPFMNKVPQRTAEQDAAEAERNKNWDPNSGLYGKNPARAASAPFASSVAPPAVAPANPATALPSIPAPNPATSPPVMSTQPFSPGPIMPGGDATGAPVTRAAPKPVTRPGSDASVNPRPPAPMPGQAPATAGAASADPFSYFVQVGAYSRTEEAEQQRAKLAMLGFGAKVTEREQAGRSVYRVRVGPFDTRQEADTNRVRIEAAGVESALVRVQK